MFLIDHDIYLLYIFVSQAQGHSHYPGTDRYSTPDGDVEEGEKEKLQQNGEASSLALGKVDAGEGELMLSPAQTPQVRTGSNIYMLLLCPHVFASNVVSLTLPPPGLPEPREWGPVRHQWWWLLLAEGDILL